MHMVHIIDERDCTQLGENIRPQSGYVQPAAVTHVVVPVIPTIGLEARLGLKGSNGNVPEASADSRNAAKAPVVALYGNTFCPDSIPASLGGTEKAETVPFLGMLCDKSLLRSAARPTYQAAASA